MKYLIWSGLIALNVWAAADDIYQYTAKNGTLVFTNKPVKNAQKVNLPPLTVYAAPMTRKDFAAQGYTAANVSSNSMKIYPYNSFHYPETNYTSRISKAPQLGTNELGRQQILNEELDHEKQALADAQQLLLTGSQSALASEIDHPERHQARIQALQDAVTEHQKNIYILSDQLGINN